MTTVFDTIAEVYQEVAEETTNAVDGGSTDRFLLVGTFTINAFGGAPNNTDARYPTGPSPAGTGLTRIGAELAYFFGNANQSVWQGVGPTGASAVYASFDGGFRQGIAALTLEGTSGYHDATTNTGAVEDVTAVASVTVPNCVEGELVLAYVTSSSIDGFAAPFTPVSGTSILVQADDDFDSHCWIGAVALADGNVTLQVNANNGSGGTNLLSWAARGLAMVDTGGGVTIVAGPLVDGAMLKSKLKGLVQ